MSDKWKILQGDVRAMLKTLPEKSVHCGITSPPYWGLRNYSTNPQIWNITDKNCKHDWKQKRVPRPNQSGGPSTKQDTNPGSRAVEYKDRASYSEFCDACGALRGELGSEPTPEMFVSNIVEVMREVRRVLRDDAVFWLNIGDSYAGSGKGGQSDSKRSENWQPDYAKSHKGIVPEGLKAKDMVGIPWLLAFALRSDGWWLRSDTIWAKGVSFCKTYSGSCMPESMTGWRYEIDDNGEAVLKKGSWRPTMAHEYVFMLAKSDKYFCDADAIRETSTGGACIGKQDCDPDGTGAYSHDSMARNNPAGRNVRSVWTVNPTGFSEAHFAVFPEGLIEPIIKVSTSGKGCCPGCGSPFVRVLNEDKLVVGWRPVCDCGENTPVPCTVLDPFNGSGTTGVVAAKLNRNYIGIELNPEYVEISRKRLMSTPAAMSKTLDNWF